MTSRSIASASRLLVLTALTLAIAGGEAWAKKRVVVAPFSGRHAEPLHDDVEEQVQVDNTLVSQSAWARARKKVRGRLGDAQVARIASDLQVDAIIEGDLDRRRGLTLTIREGLTGAISDTLVVRVRSGRLDKRELADKLLPALAKVGELGNEEPVTITPTPDTETENPLTAVKDPAPEAVETVVETTDHPPDELAMHPYNRHAAIDVQAGMSAALRNLRFTFAGNLANNQKPNGYKGSIVPSVMVTGELYPLEMGAKRSALAGLGVAFVFDRVLLLKSKLGMTEYGTSQMRYGAGLRYRHAFGNKATLPTLKVIAGWNHLDFTIDRGSTDIDLPNVTYSYLDFGLAGRFPLGTPTAAIYADARYMYVLGAGEIMDKAYYGDGGVLGIDGDLGIELIFAKRAILKVGGRYQRIAFDFDGNGTKSNNRDGDMTTQDVGGALDQYFSVYATIGYLF